MSDDHPGVIARPPIIYLVALTVGVTIDGCWPIWSLAGDEKIVVAMVLAMISLPVAIWAFTWFRKSDTSVDPHKPTTVIITEGPYKYSRNPIYVALTVLYIGLSLGQGGAVSVGLLLPVLVAMHYGVIRREEAYLEKKFGDEYLKYKNTVRRWL